MCVCVRNIPTADGRQSHQKAFQLRVEGYCECVDAQHSELGRGMTSLTKCQGRLFNLVNLLPSMEIQDLHVLPEEDDMNFEGDSSKGFVNSGPSLCPNSSIFGVFSLVFSGVE